MWCIISLIVMKKNIWASTKFLSGAAKPAVSDHLSCHCIQEADEDKLAAVTSSAIAAAVGDTSPMTVSADAALLLAQQHQQQQNEAASAAGISLDDGYMKDDVASFMKDDDGAAEPDASAFLKDSNEGLMKDEEPSAGLPITDSASGVLSQLSFWVFIPLLAIPSAARGIMLSFCHCVCWLDVAILQLVCC